MTVQTHKLSSPHAVNAESHSAPKSPGPIYYGWWMLVCAAVLGAASIPGQTNGLSVFANDLRQTLTFSTLEISLCYMFGTLLSAAALPWASPLLDKVGARVMGTAASAGLGASLLLLSTAIPEQNTATAPMPRWWLWFVCTGCFFLIRFFGQGCLSLTSRALVGTWFIRRRGIASAVNGMLAALAFGAAPGLINNLIAQHTWRTAAVHLAVFVGVAVAGMTWLFVRHSPETMGIPPDLPTQQPAVETNAKHDDTPRTKRADIAIPVDKTRAQALRTRTFWLYALALSCHALTATAHTFQMADIGAQFSLSRSDSFGLFLPGSVAAVLCNIISSLLSDRVPLKYLLYAFLAASILATAGLMHLDLELGRLVFIGGQGASGGLYVTLITVCWPRFFGRKHLGAISGAAMSLMVLASALGPVCLSSVASLFDGNFKPALAMLALMPISIALLALLSGSSSESRSESRQPQEDLH